MWRRLSDGGSPGARNRAQGLPEAPFPRVWLRRLPSGLSGGALGALERVQQDVRQGRYDAQSLHRSAAPRRCRMPQCDATILVHGAALSRVLHGVGVEQVDGVHTQLWRWCPDGEAHRRQPCAQRRL